ncbi:MAG: TIGR00295 family protein [Candidatus Altiarchaeota archaeon]
MTRHQALNLLSKVGCSQSVIEHSMAVSALAVEMGQKIRANGYGLDIEFLEVAALLHDIGRSRTHGVGHGIEGAKILHEYPFYAQVCESHLGAGIKANEAESAGLPRRDFIPETLEEKIIAHADNLVVGDKRITIEESMEKMIKRLGKGHPALNRIKKLNSEIESLIKQK